MNSGGFQVGGVGRPEPVRQRGVCRGLPPASLSALAMLRDRSTCTVGSASPWKHQHGMSLILGASAADPPPQIGTIAAHLSGWAAARLQVPNPPIDRPVRYTRFG